MKKVVIVHIHYFATLSYEVLTIQITLIQFDDTKKSFDRFSFVFFKI